MDIPDPWFCRATAGGAAQLFCFPYAGGNPAAFLPWQEPLGPDVELLVATLPGRGLRLFESPVSDLDDLVGHLAGAVTRLADRPFAIFGHSVGALLAFEVTRALRRSGGPLPEVLWVSGAEGPRTRVVRRRLHDLPDAALLDALRDYAGTPAALLAEPDLMELFLAGLRADFAVSELYTYRSEPRLNLPVHVLRGDRDPYVHADRAAGWARECTGPVREHVFDGDHFFLNPHRAAIAALLRAELRPAGTAS